MTHQLRGTCYASNHEPNGSGMQLDFDSSKVDSAEGKRRGEEERRGRRGRRKDCGIVKAAPMLQENRRLFGC